jgi:DNA-binding protein HU-beta
MNQAELIDAIAGHHSNTGVSKTAIKFVLDAQADVVKGALNSGDEVTLPGLGKLSVSERAARTARNPRTGDKIAVPAKKAPKFDAVKALKDAVNA